jgi:micrococcal nuclease
VIVQPNYTYHAEVVRVVDGDTVDLRIDYGDRLTQVRRIRLDRVDVYEKNTERGQDAIAMVRDLLPVGHMVVVTTRKPDKYGRQLGTIVTDGESVADTLLACGLAVPYDGGKKAL